MSSESESNDELHGKAFQKFLEKKKIQKTKKKEEEKKVTTKKSKDEKDVKEWTDDETSALIDILEENSCLWDTFHKDYSNRNLREIAYTEIATTVD